MHRGIDIAAPVGTEVVAARSGEVTYAGALGYSGNTVSVRSADGRHVASYLHLRLSRSARRAGSAGQRVGAVGTTGRRSVEQPHLHFGVRLAAEEHHYVDPLSLLPLLGAARTEPPVGMAPATVPLLTRPEPVRAPVAVVRRPARARVPGSLRRPEGVPVPTRFRRAPVGAASPLRPRPAIAARPRVRERGARGVPEHRRPLPHMAHGVITESPATVERAEALRRPRCVAARAAWRGDARRADTRRPRSLQIVHATAQPATTTQSAAGRPCLAPHLRTEKTPSLVDRLPDESVAVTVSLASSRAFLRSALRRVARFLREKPIRSVAFEAW